MAFTLLSSPPIFSFLFSTVVPPSRLRSFLSLSFSPHQSPLRSRNPIDEILNSPHKCPILLLQSSSPSSPPPGCMFGVLITLGGSTLTDFQEALADYLPVLLGLVKDGSPLQHIVQFVWVNQEDNAEDHSDTPDSSTLLPGGNNIHWILLHKP